MVIKNGKASVVNEVGFVNHFYEFSRFYDRHKELCDELSGMKTVLNRERGGEDTRNAIDAQNFHLAISKLHSTPLLAVILNEAKRMKWMGKIRINKETWPTDYTDLVFNLY